MFCSCNSPFIFRLCCPRTRPLQLSPCWAKKNLVESREKSGRQVKLFQRMNIFEMKHNLTWPRIEPVKDASLWSMARIKTDCCVLLQAFFCLLTSKTSKAHLRRVLASFRCRDRDIGQSLLLLGSWNAGAGEEAVETKRFSDLILSWKTRDIPCECLIKNVLFCFEKKNSCTICLGLVCPLT